MERPCMKFPTTGPPVWPRAMARSTVLPVKSGDSFAVAIDGAMAPATDATATHATAPTASSQNPDVSAAPPAQGGTIATTAPVEVVTANAEPTPHYTALPGVLAAQTVPVTQAASPAAASSIPAPHADAMPTTPPPIAAAAKPVPKAPRAMPAVAVPAPPEMAPAAILSTPEASAPVQLHLASAERPLANAPGGSVPDEPEPGDVPATAAAGAPGLLQMVPLSIPTSTAASPAADNAKPNGVRRTSAMPGTVALEAQPAAARGTAGAPSDPVQSTVVSDAPKFADALAAPAAPPGAVGLQLVEPRTHTANAVPTPVIAAQPGQIGRDLGVEIARRVSAGGNELIVRLAPAELGRIEVRMAFDDRGGLTTVIAAESPVALDMLRRDSSDLSRALSDAGFRDNGQSLRFDGGSDRGGGQPRSPWHNATPKPAVSGDFGTASDFEPSPYRPLRTSGRYDLMA